jgi:hypothetical protein
MPRPAPRLAPVTSATLAVMKIPPAIRRIAAFLRDYIYLMRI